MRKVGLDGNLPVENGSPVWRVYPPDFMASTGTGYVRINFVLDRWPSPTEGGWLQVYDTIVNGLKGRGIEIYGLIGAQAVGPPGDEFRNARENQAANAWIDRYVENFSTIVGHFRDRVKIFESFNEPNNWPTGWDRAWVHSYWFAKMLERIYRAVKLERGFTDVTLVSGPLLAHDIGGSENETNMATEYLRGTYQAGKEKHGWEDVRSTFGSYPLDGIGYHLYVRQGPESTPTDIQQAHKRYLDAISGVIRQQEGGDKKIYISEFGWSSASGEEFQARSLKAGFEFLRQDPRVALAIYFCTQDFPGEERGLCRSDKSKKPAYNAFLEQARLDREVVVVTVEPALQEKIARLEKEAQGLRQQLAASQTAVAQWQQEAQGLRQQLATSQTAAAQLQQEVQGLRQQTDASQATITQLRRQVDALRQQLVAATTTTPAPAPPVTPPATPVVPTPVVTPSPVASPAIAPPPMEDIVTSLRRHPIKRFDQRTLDQIKYLIIQHSVLPGDFPPEKIADYLVEKRQWPGIGYHFYITSDGKTYQTNHLETVCYFAGSNVQYNPLGVCICFAGDFTTEVPTAAQLSSGGKLLAFLMQELRLPLESIRGQKEFVNTQSPGQQWDSGQMWKNTLLAEVKAARA